MAHNQGPMVASNSPQTLAVRLAGDGLPPHAGSDLGPVLNQILNALDEIRARLAGVHKQLYTISEIAQLTGRSDYTVRRWVKEGRLAAVRVRDTGPRGRLLIAHDQLHRLTGEGMGGRVPEICSE